MQPIKIEKLNEEKYKIIWDEPPNNELYLSDIDFLDFYHTLKNALDKLKRKENVKTELLLASKKNTTHRVFVYKNRTLQIEWGNLIRKLPPDEYEKNLKIIEAEAKKIIERKERERQEYEKELKKVKKLFIFGLVSLFVALAFSVLTVAFLFFVFEYIHIPFIIAIISWSFFAFFYYMQQHNVKAFVKYGQQNFDSVLPMLSQLPSNRKVVEMLVIFLVIFTIMAVYFAKTIPKILNFYKSTLG